MLDGYRNGAADISQAIDQRYSDALEAMHEESLWKLARVDNSIAVFRLLWLPTSGPPISVRIQFSDKKVRLEIIKLDGYGGYDIGKIAYRKSVEGELSLWNRLVEESEEASFWRMPTRIDDLGLDGEHFVLEGVKDGIYHVVDRWSPRFGAYRKICKSMLKHAQIETSSTASASPAILPVMRRFAYGLLVLLFGAVLLTWYCLRRRAEGRKDRHSEAAGGGRRGSF
ncbi:hypothetical protein [Aquisphaera insulae]|uniref:hypothetical protein n=1 Tax=Aquisphaera insulae TaxID=2712864 RepID=UPI0013EC131F|nr:hypothetical protein [Aquisphaera insulae]